MLTSRKEEPPNMKKIIATTIFLGVIATSGIAHADYPPVPSDLGKRVETPTPAPARLAEAAAVATKPESIAVVIEPKKNLKRVTLRVVNVDTGRITTRTVTVASSAKSVTPSLSLPAGEYRVAVIGTLKNGSEVRWSAGRQVIRKKR